MAALLLRRVGGRLNLAMRALRGVDRWQLGGPPLSDARAAALRPTFVLSTGRCGTRWLTVLLSHSKKVATNHDLQPELVRQSRLAWEERAIPTERRELLRATRDDLLSGADRVGRHYVETNNRITFLAPAAALAYPQSRFVHLLRHPADFVRSGLRRGWYHGEEGHELGRIRMADTADWVALDDLERVAWLWQETNDFISDFLATLPEERWLRMRSEDMFKQPEAAAALCRFLGAEDIGPDAARRLSGRRINRQRGSDFPRYEDWSPGQVRALATMCPRAAELGYDLVGAERAQESPR